MKYKQTVYVELSIGSKEFDAEDFINTFRITPTKVWETKHGERYFEYRIDAKDTLEGLDEAIEELRLTFLPQSTEIRTYALQKGLYTKIDVIVIERKKQQCIGVCLNRKFIEFLNDIGAEIEIDVYS